MSHKKNPGKYGEAPYSLAVCHGGPGTGGDMAPLATQLAGQRGVLEPIQTALSVEGQIEELKRQLAGNASFPVTLIGHSWGAWLIWLFAARYPEQVKKLILVSSGPYETSYARGLDQLRMSRLNEEDRKEVDSLLKIMADKQADAATFARFGALFEKADAFDPIIDTPGEGESVEIRPDIFHAVWPQAAALRESGQLLERGKQIRCPVIAIHGDYDPHPAAGVREPLSTVLKNFRFILLQNCGHKPWMEKQAREAFFQAVEEVLEN